MATIVVWLLLLWAGWTLILAADASAVVSSATRVPANFMERAYFAGFTIFTLGMGDYAPVGAPWQLLTVIATVSGLALTTAAITYIFPVVTAATQRTQQASVITALGGQAHRIVLNAYDNGSVRYLEPVLIQLTDGLLLTAQRHLARSSWTERRPRSMPLHSRWICVRCVVRSRPSTTPPSNVG